jgi:two-component system chemotaxis response regulator CheY
MTPSISRVVIADDDGFFRQLLGLVAGTLGWQVVAEAGDGGEAVSKYTEHKPDLLLLDVNMPVMNGDAALREILAADSAARVVMLSAEDSSEKRQAYLDAGASGFVVKGVPEEIAAALQGLFRDD